MTEKELQAKRVEVCAALARAELNGADMDSAERLAALCDAVVHPRFGWTLGACEDLRLYLIRLIGGVDDDGDASKDDGPTVPCAAGRADCGERHQQPTKDVDPDVMSLSVRTFELDTPKAVATKVLEEAAEAFAAWQQVDACCFGGEEFRDTPTVEGGTCKGCMLWARAVPCQEYTTLADELADVVQVVCNLAARYGIDMAAAMERCERRQRERGRL